MNPKITKELIMAMRRDTRFTFNQLSLDTGIPQSTLFEKLKIVKKEYITAQFSQLDWSNVGFPMRLFCVMKSPSDKKDQLLEMLRTHPNVNTVLRISNSVDVLTEAMFPSFLEAEDFCDRLKEMGASKVRQFYVVKPFREEHFLTEKEHFRDVAFGD